MPQITLTSQKIFIAFILIAIPGHGCDDETHRDVAVRQPEVTEQWSGETPSSPTWLSLSSHCSDFIQYEGYKDLLACECNLRHVGNKWCF